MCRVWFVSEWSCVVRVCGGSSVNVAATIIMETTELGDHHHLGLPEPHSAVVIDDPTKP